MAQINEDYVSFETAKLLKEKGFQLPVKNYYFLYTEDVKPNLQKKYGAKKNWNSFAFAVSRPSQSLVMKWLREVHHLVIQIEFIDFLEHGEVWLYSIIERKTIKRLTGRDEDFTEHSYEEACEAAIKYCLENLI